MIAEKAKIVEGMFW